MITAVTPCRHGVGRRAGGLLEETPTGAGGRRIEHRAAGREPREGRAVRHLPGRHAGPAGRPGHRASLLERLGHEVVVPPGQALLRADARQHRLPPRGRADRRQPRARLRRRARRSSRRPARAWPRSTTSRPTSPAGPASTRWPTRPQALAGRTYELSAVPGRRPRRHRRRRLLPAPGHLPPDLPLAAAAAGRRPAAAAAARRPRAGPGRAARRRRSAAASAAPSRSRTPTPRRRCSPTRWPTCSSTHAEVCTAGDASCLMHIGGGLSRLRVGHPHRAPGRDPRLHRGRRDPAPGDDAGGVRR